MPMRNRRSLSPQGSRWPKAAAGVLALRLRRPARSSPGAQTAVAVIEPPLWNEGASPFPHEREALAFIKSRLPNNEPYRAWTNMEFIADDGSVNEIDALVVTPRGFFLIEIKSHPGIMFGDGQNWRWRRPNGSDKPLPHPLILANTKAKRLRSLLSRQPALRKEREPFITALVFLSSPDLDCRLHDIARTSVCGRDRDPLPLGVAPPELKPTFAPLPGIVATIKDPSKARLRGTSINRPMSAMIAEAIEQAGLKPSNRGRRAGDWELGELLDEGPGWQDFAGSRPRMSAKRRVRVYLAGLATTADEESRLRREAEREFKVVQGLRHEGVSQPLDLIQAERGPALLFDRADDEERLDLWASAGIEPLGLDERIELVRQVGEALAHAHHKRISHRALSARAVLVRRTGDGIDTPMGPLQLLVGHWQAGARDLATRLTTHVSTEEPTLGDQLLDRLGSDEQVYLAPETFIVDDPNGVALDVFSLGAIAFLLLSGQPPASDLVERERLLTEHQGLQLSAAVDGLPDDLETFVAAATDPIPANRPTIRELLDLLDGALDALTAPVDEGSDPEAELPSEPAAVADPLAAHQGDLLEGGWKVLRRLGSGSTAVALLCTRPGATAPEVLKVAKDEEYAERLRDEARALGELRHIGIVELFGVERIGGRTSLRLAPAGDPADRNGLTLADRLTAQGRLGLDLLDRFGDDLLEIVGVLESEGVPHRDLKPDNLGVRPRRGDRSLHLVLFDFSLARTPDTALQAGTPGYLDPFLAERPGKRWDPAADRYAAAATLHEMATGIRPIWGDGRTDPIHLPDEMPRLDPELFDPSVRDGLTAFFQRALHRKPANRFDTADQMRQAWRGVFAAAIRPQSSQDGESLEADADMRERILNAADPTTPVVDLGLSAAAASALDRLGVGTVEQMLAFPTADWNRAPGVGLPVRREVLAVIGGLRERLDVAAGDDAASIDRLASTLLPKPQTPQAQSDLPLLRTLLGISRGAHSENNSLPIEPEGPGLPAWRGASEVKAAHNLDRAEFDAVLHRARSRWLKQPGVTQARNDLATILERAGGVLSGEELALALLSQRGSTATGAERLRRGRAVVRAALEAESSRDSNRFTWRRLGGGTAIVVASAGRTSEDGVDALDGEELADYAANLGVAADQIATADPLATPASAIERLRLVALPAGLPPLPDHRLTRLAAACSATAAVSSRLELYPRGLPPSRAVRIARATLLGSGALSEQEVRDRIRTRFPDAAPLPARPELDSVLTNEVGIIWSADRAASDGTPLAPGFRVPPPPAAVGLTVIGSSGTRYRTGTATSAPEDARAVAELTDERLRRHAANGGYLVLTVAPNHQERAIRELEAVGATQVDADRIIINALRAESAAKGIDWERAILVTDAEGPTGERWPRLLAVARTAAESIRSQLLHGSDHVVLTHPGLLARYDLLGLLDDLRERTTRIAEDAQTLRTLWVLIPTDDPNAAPALAGRAVPITTPTEHLALPDLWLRNLHHTTAASTGAPQ